MESKEYKQLLEKYYAGETTLSEERKLKKNSLDPEKSFHDSISLFKTKSISVEEAVEKIDPQVNLEKPFFFTSFRFKVAAAISVLIISSLVIYFWRPGDMKMNDQRSIYQELESSSSINRFKSLSKLEEYSEIDKPLREELLYLLDNDQNTNVRLAVLEIIRTHLNYEEFSEGLVRSFKSQDSPIVQMAMLDVMGDVLTSADLENLRQSLVNKKLNKYVEEKLIRMI